MELTSEQQFELRKIQMFSEQMSHPQLTQILVETYRLMVIRDAFWRQRFGDELPAIALPDHMG